MQGRKLAKSAPGLTVGDAAARLRLLEIENAQLRHALESRVIIEQAKGCVSVRRGVPVEVAFELIRGASRSQRREIHELAAEIVANAGHFTVERR
ncbi:MAG: ANTAR domain-containing protein [Actinobacteria bacterium]|nr:ANTAR domain-containing protein [Actinomycetota bacterium]